MRATAGVLAALAALALHVVLTNARTQTQTRVSLIDNGRFNTRLFKAINGSEGHFDEVLKNLMVPRVVGTPSHQKVKEFIIGEMRRLGWHVETDPFNAHTPIFGTLRFENIIAKINPSAKQMLVLSCHYDSKYFPNVEFLGATDSAVPCAMLINLAHSLEKDLARLKNADLGLELWFFDGEEAFLNWGPTDSIYGARHLASKMERENTLGKIKLLVLLDLLGSPGPTFFNYFPASDNAFRKLAAGEKSLSDLQQLRTVGTRSGFPGQRTAYFHERSAPHYVEDDHTPFLRKGVSVLHIIPHKFPNVWHTQQDDWSAIDRPTIEDLNKILRMFVLDYYNL